jgi:hypothetical protein
MPRPTRHVSLLAAAFVIGAVTGLLVGSAWAGFDRTVSTSHSVGTAVLAQPTGLTTAGGARLSWTATTSTWATGTRVFRSATPGGPFTQIAEIAGLATTTYTDSPGFGTFSYALQAYYTGNGANWNSVNSTEKRGGIARIQTAVGGGTVANITATYATAPTAGNLLVAVVATRASGTITAPSGWSTAVRQTGSPSQGIFYKIAGASELTTVSASTTASGNGTGIHIYEYSGVTILDASASSSGTGTAVASGSLTTTTANNLVLAAMVKNTTTGSFSAFTNSFVERNDFRRGTSTAMTTFAAADRISGAPGAYSTTGTSATSNAWRGQIVAFR